MYTDDYQFQQELLSHKVYSSWQFILFTRKNIETVQYCYDIINRIIDKMEMKTVRWEQDLFSDFEDVVINGQPAKRVSVTVDNQPEYELRVAGEKTDPWFLFDKIIRDFFQYSMNSLDSISQIANAGLLANNGKKVDSVDFQQMAIKFNQQTYKTSFPKTADWYDRINNSNEFKYIEAINNRTKHTADIANKLSIGILGSGTQAEIGPFFRKEVPHEKRKVVDQLLATLDFLHKAWDDFLMAFCEEFVLDTYVDNRYHQIGGVYQQKMISEPSANWSYAFIKENDFNSMPSEIYVLLAYDREGISAHICPFDTIIIQENEHSILGRYCAVESIGEDCLIGYRKYIKDEAIKGPACLFYESQKQTKYYHANPFFSVQTVTDDDDFLKRVSLPF